MIQDILKNISNEDSNTLETDTLVIKNNALITEDSSIQITNISMVSKGNFTSPVTLIDFIILAVLFLVSFIPPYIGFLLFAGYAYLVYQKHQNHLKSKYFIVFNLGSSRNYNLFFESQNFRDTVYTVITKSFNNKNQDIHINIKNQEITGDNYESGASRNTVTGDHNIVGTSVGSDSQVNSSGDINNNSNIVKDSHTGTVNMQNSIQAEIPWSEMAEQLRLIANHQTSDADKAIYLELLEISEAKDEGKLKAFVNKMSSFFQNELVKDTLTGVAGNVIAALLMK